MQQQLNFPDYPQYEVTQHKPKSLRKTTIPAQVKTADSIKPDFSIVPRCSVHPNRINIYSEVVWHPYKPVRQNRNDITKVSNSHNGKISSTAKRKIGKAIEYLLFLSNEKYLPDTAHGKAYKFKIAFVTLTLPSKQVHPDSTIKKECLNQFLIEARKKWNVKNYIWRAEKQSNGNLHFHILVDTFIPWLEMRNTWNRIVNKLGYVERYRDELKAFHAGGFKVRRELLKTWSYKNQVKAYRQGKKNDWQSPNSTDIHSVYKINNIQKYLSKYYTKDEQSQSLKGRLWSCNEELSNIKGAQLIMANAETEALRSLMENHKPHTYEGDYFTTIYISPEMLQDPRLSPLFHPFAEYIFQHFRHNLSTYII